MTATPNRFLAEKRSTKKTATRTRPPNGATRCCHGARRPGAGGFILEEMRSRAARSGW